MAWQDIVSFFDTEVERISLPVIVIAVITSPAPSNPGLAADIR
jgi:hypothetical protein